MTYSLRKPTRMGSPPSPVADVRQRVMQAFRALLGRVSEKLRDHPVGIFRRLAIDAPEALAAFDAAEEAVDRAAFEHVEGKLPESDFLTALARYEAAWLAAAKADRSGVQARDERKETP
jgi:hypothetical protein